MRFHLNVEDSDDLRPAVVADDMIRAALLTAKNEGLVAPQVFAETMTHGSRSHDVALEVRLYAEYKVAGDKRRRPNPGGGPRRSDDIYAATYDEWGHFLAHLFDAAPDTKVVGAYDGHNDFHARTRYQFGG